MPITPVQRREFPWLTATWLGYWGLLFVVMHIPVPQDALSRLHVSDKTLHFAVYFVLVLLSGLALRHRLRNTKRNRDCEGTNASQPGWHAAALCYLVLWAVVYVMYGAFDEWSQQFVNRSTSLGDWCANVGGILAATVLLVGWSLWRGPAEVCQP